MIKQFDRGTVLQIRYRLYEKPAPAYQIMASAIAEKCIFAKT